MSAEKPLLYVILGASGSGRREVVADLLEAGLAADAAAHPHVLLAEAEAAGEADARLGSRGTWRSPDEALEAEVPDGATHVFFVADGRGNPVDQIERLKPWLASRDLELARVICVVNCRLAERHPPLLAWYDACIHFSDVVLLHQREGVSNKWLSDFRARYEGKFYPCLFELVKAGRVKNPALLLEPQARRISHYFDEEAEWVIEGDEEEGAADEEGPVDAHPAVDPYFERWAGGRRVREIPDIAEYLDREAAGAG